MITRTVLQMLLWHSIDKNEKVPYNPIVDPPPRACREAALKERFCPLGRSALFISHLKEN